MYNLYVQKRNRGGLYVIENGHILNTKIFYKKCIYFAEVIKIVIIFYRNKISSFALIRYPLKKFIKKIFVY